MVSDPEYDRIVLRDLRLNLAAAREDGARQHDQAVEATGRALRAEQQLAAAKKETWVVENRDAVVVHLLEQQLTEAQAQLRRVKELARIEHTLLTSIQKRLQDIGEINDSPNTNLTGAIHGVIDGYVSWRHSGKTVAAQLQQMTAERDRYKEQGRSNYDRANRELARLRAAEARLKTQMWCEHCGAKVSECPACHVALKAEEPADD